MSRPFLDLRQALRAVPRAPVFFGAAMLSLALGIGGVTAFFGLAHHYLFRPLPYTHPERLVSLGERRITQGGANDLPMGPSSFQAWREDARSFEHLALFRPLGREVDTGTGPTFGPVASVSEGFFETLGLRPALGRFFLRAEETPGQPRLAVLSHRCWQERYASDPSALGRTVSIAGEPFVIVGVAPDFTFPNTWIQRAPLVFPLMQLRDRSSYRAIHMFEGLGCLRPGIGREQALAELETIQARQAAAFPDTNRGVGARLVDLRSRLFGNRSRSLGLLTGAAGLLLLIAASTALVYSWPGAWRRPGRPPSGPLWGPGRPSSSRRSWLKGSWWPWGAPPEAWCLRVSC